RSSHRNGCQGPAAASILSKAPICGPVQVGSGRDRDIRDPQSRRPLFMTTTAQGIVDSLDFTDLFSREVGTSPKASFYVPTDVTGTKADRSATVLKNQINHAAERFHELGTSNGETESILSPIRELGCDSSCWRQQCRGLAIFAEAGFPSAVRITIEVEQSVVVDIRFDVLPLVPVLESGGKCYILALAKNSVRLFDATRNSIEQLPLG